MEANRAAVPVAKAKPKVPTLVVLDPPETLEFNSKGHLRWISTKLDCERSYHGFEMNVI